MEYLFYKILLFQMYAFIIMGVCLLFSSGKIFSKAVAIVGYIFISLVAFGAYTSNALEGENSAYLYASCLIATIFPLLFVTKLGRQLAANIVASVIYDGIKLVYKPFGLLLKGILNSKHK